MIAPRPLARLLVALAALAPVAPLSAAVTSWEFTGTFEFPFDPGVDAIISGGEFFTLTFDFDDSVGASSSGPGQAAYDAISNLGLTIRDSPDEFGVELYDASGGLSEVANFYNTGNHQWSIFWSPDFSSIPDVAGVDYDGVDEDLVLLSLDIFSLDSDEALFASDPPELLTPAALDPDETTFEIYWSAVSDFNRSAIAIAQVESITLVPEPSVPLMLGISVACGVMRRRRA